MLERTDRVAGLLRKHGGLTVTYSGLIQPVGMTFRPELMKITAGGMNAVYKRGQDADGGDDWGVADDA
ncbi:branched-chain amino acid ABC transporter substrate-binding protein [Sphingopyxis sp. EG6]|nr:branched-chain amino acid ABC transporter substrate-binding protein [Sphingopyxis sp. EG6]